MDGTDVYKPVIGKFCGYFLPPDVLSTGPSLMLWYTAAYFLVERDGVWLNNGIKVSWGE